MNHRIRDSRLVLALLSIWLPGIGLFADSDTTAVEEAAREAPSASELASATYRGIDELVVTLVDSHWEGEPVVEGGASVPRVGLAVGFRVTGDLDEDGNEEAVALLHYNFGGSGVFSYLAVVGRGAGGDVENLATSEIGDRVQLRSAKIAGGALTIETVEVGPEDGACCPGQLRRRVFALEDAQLAERSSEEVKRQGLSSVQLATRRPPCSTPRLEIESASPMTTVPGSMVSVAPLLTKTWSASR